MSDEAGRMKPEEAEARRRAYEAEKPVGERAARYTTDDRDRPERNVLEILHGGNGDWYVATAPEGEGTAGRGVRICTSGGAQQHAPGLANAIAAAYRAILGDGADTLRETLNKVDRQKREASQIASLLIWWHTGKPTGGVALEPLAADVWNALYEASGIRNDLKDLSELFNNAKGEVKRLRAEIAAVKVTLDDLGVPPYAESGGDLDIRVRAIAQQRDDAERRSKVLESQRDAVVDCEWGDTQRARAYAESVERERDEARAEVERLHGEVNRLERQRDANREASGVCMTERDAARAEVERLTKDRDEARADADRLAAGLAGQLDALHAARAQAAAMRVALGDLVTSLACCSGPVSPAPSADAAVRGAQRRAHELLGVPDAGKKFAERMETLQRERDWLSVQVRTLNAGVHAALAYIDPANPASGRVIEALRAAISVRESRAAMAGTAEETTR